METLAAGTYILLRDHVRYDLLILVVQLSALIVLLIFETLVDSSVIGAWSAGHLRITASLVLLILSLQRFSQLLFNLLLAVL